MVKYPDKQLDSVFHALSDRTRRAILTRLVRGEHDVSELAEPFAISLAAVSKHIGVLEDAGLVQKTKHGRNLRCQANLDPLKNANRLLESLADFWQHRLQALDDLLIATGEMKDDTGCRKRRPKTRDKKDPSRKKRKSV